MQITKSGLLIVTLTALLVSLSSIFTRFAYDGGANPQTMVLFRFLIFCSLYLLILLTTKKTFALPAQNRIYVYLAGVFYTIGSGSLLVSLFYLPVGLAVIIFYTYPIFTLIGEKILAKKKTTLIETICFIMAFCGLVIALNIKTDSISPIGIGFALCASIGMSTSYLICDQKLKSIDSFELTFHLALTGLILLTLYISFTSSFNPGELSAKNSSFVFLASLCFAIGFWLMFKGIKVIGAVNTAMILNLEPIFTIALAFVLLKESLSMTQLIGAILVLIAIFVIQRHQNINYSAASDRV